MNRLIFIIFLAFFITACSTDNEKNKNVKQPNILIITADDLAYNSIGAFGCQVKDITPNLDRLANEGLRFTHAHVTSAVCQPCRQSLLTGLYPHNNGAEGFEPINDTITTLTQLLREAGYINGILGKEIHHQPKEKFCWDFMPYTDKDSIWRSGNSRNPDLFYKYSDKFFKMANQEKKPFFLIANSHDPHRPFPASANDTLTWGDNMPPINRLYKTEDTEMLGYLPDIPDVRKEVTQYYNGVYRCDQNLGGVLKALEENDLEDNTVVIFLSDHGASFPFSKAQCYLNSTLTPLIIKWPELSKPGSVDEEHLISTNDIMPTILEAVGLKLPSYLDGESIMPIIKNEETEGREYLFTSFYQLFSRKRIPMRCLQNKKYGYIYNFWSDGEYPISGDATGGLTWQAMIKAGETDPEIKKRVQLYKYRVREEFYDFKNDPDALHNLIDDPAYRDELTKFREMMLKYMAKFSDPAYEAYRNREKPGVVEEFMVQEIEKSLHTKAVEHF